MTLILRSVVGVLLPILIIYVILIKSAVVATAVILKSARAVCLIYCARFAMLTRVLNVTTDTVVALRTDVALVVDQQFLIILPDAMIQVFLDLVMHMMIVMGNVVIIRIPVIRIF
jgi:hypothetical protein